MLDLRTCAALPHVGGVVPLFERLRCSLHGCELCHNRCHAGCTSPLWQEQALSTCAAVEQPDSVPEPRHCRSLESWQVCAWWTLPGFPAQSARERRTATCASPPNRQLCETPEKREGSRFQGSGPCPWELAVALCEPLMTQEVQWGCLQWTDDSRSRQQCRQIVCQRNKNRL